VVFAFSSTHRTGWAAVAAAGLVRFDPVALTLLDYFDLEPGYPIYLGGAREIALVADHWLYLARVGEGLDLYQDEPWFRLVHLTSPRPFVTLDASPDQRWLVVNINASVPYGGHPGSTPQVYEAPGGLTLWYEYPVRMGRDTDAVRFHPDGKRFFVMAEYQVNVYLLRPR